MQKQTNRLPMKHEERVNIQIKVMSVDFLLVMELIIRSVDAPF